MYFPLPTFVPGSVASVIALVLLAYHMVSPPLMRSWRARAHRHQDPTPFATQFRLGAWCVLAEILLVMAFVGTASAVSPADIGWAPPTLADLEPLALVGVGGLALFVFLVLSLAQSHRRLLIHVRSGELPPQVSRDALLEFPQDRRELAFLASGCVLSLLSHVLVVYTVLFPTLALVFDSALLAAIVLGLLGGWQHMGQGGGMIWGMTLLTTAGLFVYALLVPGSLLVPVLLWASYWAVGLGIARAFVGLPIPKETRPLHPVEVTLLDADGRPIERA